MKKLFGAVEIDRRFARSARIDADLNGTPPLIGYILQESTRRALEGLAVSQSETRQGAFTWTGPYGGGKSSAALLVANIVGGPRQNRQIAKKIAGDDLSSIFAKAFPERKGGWLVVPITGNRSDLRGAIAENSAKCLGWSGAVLNAAQSSDAALIKQLTKASEARAGILLLIDELGKFLEYAVSKDGDVHLLQDLAEFSARSGGKFVTIGILHQSFDQYAGRLSRETRQEWAKVQGRYQDISFLAGTDETTALLARAIVSNSRPKHAADDASRLAKIIAKRRPIDLEGLTKALSHTWPLNPITALLLGPLSRHRFAQNERSVFGFLSSSEPYGFSEYLKNEPADKPRAYSPCMLWDYVTANFGMALTSGPEGSRFSLAFEAIERAAAKGNSIHVDITKTAALIEFFRNGTGLSVADEVLEISLEGVEKKVLKKAISDLVEWAILIRQPRLGGYALFAGSDFDLDAAIDRDRGLVDPEAIQNLPSAVGLGFAIAKRHYFRTGSLRAFEVVLQILDEHTDATEVAQNLKQRKSRSSGLFVVLLPSISVKQSEAERFAANLADALNKRGVVCAVTAVPASSQIRTYGTEYASLARIEKEHHQLQGDRIARREVSARRSVALDVIQAELTAALHNGRWRLGPQSSEVVLGSPSIVATELADQAFSKAAIIQSELVQRDRPSSNAMAAVRDLAHAMVSSPDKENLGISGYPAEMGLYLTVLKEVGLHRRLESGNFGFAPPDNKVGKTIRGVWEVLSSSSDENLGKIYQKWAAQPFGMKQGLMPIIALAYMLTHRDRLAVYVDGVFQTGIDTVFVDRLLQNPATVRLKTIDRTSNQVSFLSALAKKLCLDERSKPLRIAQKLFHTCYLLPEFARRTTRLPEDVCAIRDCILRASDPEDLLFDKLAKLPLGERPADAIVEALDKAQAAYPTMLSNLKATLARALGVDGETFAGISQRAATVIQLTNDLRFDAFAGRVAALEAEGQDIEGIASLLIHKPPSGWSDSEVDQAILEVVRFGRRFREAEALAAVHKQRGQGEALAVVIGLDPKTLPAIASFELTAKEKLAANKLAEQLRKSLKPGDDRVGLAALAKAAEGLMGDFKLGELWEPKEQ